jgi:hypothetical protein
MKNDKIKLNSSSTNKQNTSIAPSDAKAKSVSTTVKKAPEKSSTASQPSRPAAGAASKTPSKAAT